MVPLCETCVREVVDDFAQELQRFTQQLQAHFERADDGLDEEIADAPFEALMEACFSGDDSQTQWDDPFAGSCFEARDEHGDDESVASLPENLFQVLEAVGDEASARCSDCGASWTKIAGDERVGCARCYQTFRASLSHLLEHIQATPQHEGKTPRAARKRALRLEHLRQRRHHQLQLLQGRLSEAVRAERYEEAAILRDKIKALPSAELGVRSAE